MNLLGTFFRVHNALGTAVYFQVVYNTPQVQMAQAGYAFTPVGGIHLFAITGQWGEVLREYVNGSYHFQLGVIAYSDPQLLNPVARFGIAYEPSARIATSPPHQELAQGGFYEAMETELRIDGSMAVSAPPPINVPITITVPPAPPISHPSGPFVPPVLPPPFPPPPATHAPSTDQLNRVDQAIVEALSTTFTVVPIGDQGSISADQMQFDPNSNSIHFHVTIHYKQSGVGGELGQLTGTQALYDFTTFYQGDIDLADPVGSLEKTAYGFQLPHIPGFNPATVSLNAEDLAALGEAVALILA